LVNGALVKALPYEDGARILYLEGRNVERSQDMQTSVLDFVDWRAQAKSFERLSAYAARQFNLADDETAPERVAGAEITVDGFQVLRVVPQLGRGFAEDERDPGLPRSPSSATRRGRNATAARMTSLASGYASTSKRRRSSA
jgi:hypothetical protein